MVLRTVIVATCFAVAVLSSSAHAALLTNGSFEDATNFNGGGNNSQILSNGSTAMTGWTVVNQEVSWDGPTNPYSLSASEGGYFLDLTSDRDASPFGGVQQSFASIAGHNYSLSFDLGSSSLYGFPVSLTATAGGTSGLFSSTSTAPGNVTWESKSLAFTATGSLTTVSLVGAFGRSFIGLDNVSVVDLGPSAAPEPASWAMMVGGFGIMGAAMRRRRRSNVSFA